jgi:hypothetical protein
MCPIDSSCRDLRAFRVRARRSAADCLIRGHRAVPTRRRRHVQRQGSEDDPGITPNLLSRVGDPFGARSTSPDIHRYRPLRAIAPEQEVVPWLHIDDPHLPTASAAAW